MKNTKMKELKETLGVAYEIALRIDDAPVLSDYIRAFVTEKDMEV